MNSILFFLMCVWHDGCGEEENVSVNYFYELWGNGVHYLETLFGGEAVAERELAYDSVQFFFKCTKVAAKALLAIEALFAAYALITWNIPHLILIGFAAMITRDGVVVSERVNLDLSQRSNRTGRTGRAVIENLYTIFFNALYQHSALRSFIS